ncbi:IMPACT family protein [Silvanigrella aquatica]|uniref:Impact N-terminal domain-containing protein n=1 Tax=Silvanigrella aquatica TaxID=1915309 RepID=A0A1L4CYQ4_9BACT|nr:YigZ family protein [Silvanigrella aquatica]APJ03084.1 hypothetical protein AXG55_03830 [Silvanigrella aquatica]
MISCYKTLAINSTSEIVIEKSKFIATLKRVTNEDEVSFFFSQIKKKYWDATHNCTAHILTSGIVRSSDDGEPSGTAGKPILECLKKTDLKNVAVVITRYFGGIKLGSGGLIRAYTAATQNGIKYSGIVEFKSHQSFVLSIEYSQWDKLENFLKINKIKYEKPNFTDKVTVKFFTQNGDEILNHIRNLFNSNIEYHEENGEFIEIPLLSPI